MLGVPVGSWKALGIDAVCAVEGWTASAERMSGGGFLPVVPLTDL